MPYVYSCIVLSACILNYKYVRFQYYTHTVCTLLQHTILLSSDHSVPPAHTIDDHFLLLVLPCSPWYVISPVALYK